VQFEFVMQVFPAKRMCGMTGMWCESKKWFHLSN